MRSLGILVLLCLPASARVLPPAVAVSTDLLHAAIKPSSTTADNVGPTSPNRVLPGEPVKRKNYLIPAIEIPIFQLALNGFDRVAYGSDYYVTAHSIKEHIFHGPWVVDKDDFAVNQVGHPYQGSLYYGFARSSGLNFWEGWVYSNVGSALWEITGETSDPSINDQVASGTGGPMIGEPLYRMANLVLEGGGAKPGFWRELGAAFISPPTALNRYVFGERYSPVLKSRDPAVFWQLQVGAGVNAKVESGDNPTAVGHRVAAAQFSMAYGLPGKDKYLYLRPFDYFNFEAMDMRQNRKDFTNVMTRGLLFGSKYETEDLSYRGVWGLYGSYDYLAPQVYRLSTTAASFGTTFQWWLSRRVALQGTATAGLGYGAAGTIAPRADESDFHYGAAPQGLLALRLIFGKRAMLDTTGRGYYISGVGANKAHGTEKIGRVNTSLVFRIYENQALGINYLATSREARYSSASLSAKRQAVQSVGVTYSLLGGAHFGAVEWDR